MSKRKSGLFTLLLVLLSLSLALTGCDSGLLATLVPPPAATSTPAPGTALVPSPSASPATPTATRPAVEQLTLWMPVQFDPNSGTVAGNLLRARLDEFTRQNPDLSVEVRIKASTGEGNLMESLAAASAAAPDALPSVIILSRSELENAALKQLILPLDAYTDSPSDADWYPYARQLATVQESTFGIPLAGDALLLIYRPVRYGSTPDGWEPILGHGQPLLFPAADPQSLLTLGLYLSAGGEVEDSQHRPVLQAGVLSKVLHLYADGASQGVFPSWLAQINTDNQAWQSYLDQRGNLLVTWSSRYLTELPVDSSATTFPALSTGAPVLASGWLAAVSEPQTERAEAAVRLAEFLTQAEFLSQWTPEVGYLPVRPSSLEDWPNQSLQELITQLVNSAQVVPSNTILSSLAPAMQEASLNVIKNQSDPDQAAKDAAARLSGTTTP
ncbi:MAG: extracellular solute-binding protein [Chloroflexi bacterium]|nr:extracellular solute-binding protein [Chloroflexota bacterium]